MHAVEQRVRGFVRDDVVRQAGEDHAAGHVIGGVIRFGLEVAEEQPDFDRRVIRVLLAQRMRIDPQALHVVPSRSSDAGPADCGAGSTALRRPSARSKFWMVRLATAYTIC